MSDMVEWECPYCLRWTLIQKPGVSKVKFGDNSQQFNDLYVTQVVCRNSSCKKLTLSAKIVGMIPYGNPAQRGARRGIYRTYSLLPESKAKTQPDYIPIQVLNDYVEACRIVELSPKAAATLVRRCLQGMIRDFFKVSEKTLYLEIDKIKGLVSSELWDAIDGIRKVGNIGAHMEADVNLIIDVEPEEAQVLIDLTEQLFKEWYVERHNKETRLAAIKTIVSEKAEQKKPPAV